MTAKDTGWHKTSHLHTTPPSVPGQHLERLPATLLLDPPTGPIGCNVLPACSALEARRAAIRGHYRNAPMFCPTIDRLLMHTEAICHLLLVQHSALAKAIIARAKAVGVHKIGYVLRRKAVSRSAWSRGCARTKPSLVEYSCDFGVNVVVE